MSNFWAFALDNATFEDENFEKIFEYIYIYISIAWGSWLWETNIGDSSKLIGWSIQFTPHDWILREKALAKLSILFHHAKVFSPWITSWQHSHSQIEPSQLMIVVYKIWNRIRSQYSSNFCNVSRKFLQCLSYILREKKSNFSCLDHRVLYTAS